MQLFNAENKKWGQAHTWGAYVFSQFIYQNQQSKIVDFEIVEGGESFYIHLDKELLFTEGQELISKFLLILQTYKSTGCIERAQKFWDRYSAVDEFFLKIRDIVIQKKKPRRVELNNNLLRHSETEIEVQYYEESFESIISSYIDRYGSSKELIDTILGEWDKYRKLLRVPRA